MSSSAVSFRKLAVLGTALLPAAFGSPTLLTRNVLSPRAPLVSAVEPCSSAAEQKHQPAFDFDTDSCYNAPAVGPDGSINGGRDPCDAVDSPSQNCRDASYLDANNVYVRTRCNNGWCAHLYGYYMEVDAKSTCSGHRHDWEHVVVWTEGDAARYVAASAHGGYDVRAFDDVQQDNGHAKIVYHRDGSSTHAMRFAKDDGTDEPPENDAGVWFYGGLVSYYGFPSNEIRDAMMGNDWGSGKIDFSDARIADALEAAKGGNDIPLDVGVDESVPGDRVCE